MNSSSPRQEPMRPDSSSFKDRPILVALFECWLDARGDKLLPSKKDFETAALNHPDLLPDLALIEIVSATEYRYRYMGSDRVQRRGKDQTRENASQAFAPKARQFVSDWTYAIVQTPHITLWRDRTLLPSGVMSESTNLSVVLTDDEGQPNSMAVISDVDDAYRKELTKGGFKLGSGGIQILPIDIGLGTPDLPLVLK